jgi:hypothetical protein
MLLSDSHPDVPVVLPKAVVMRPVQSGEQYVLRTSRETGLLVTCTDPAAPAEVNLPIMNRCVTRQSEETRRLDTVEVGVDVVDIRVNALLQRRHLTEMCVALLAGSHQKLCIAVRLERFEGGHRKTLLHFRNT